MSDDGILKKLGLDAEQIVTNVAQHASGKPGARAKPQHRDHVPMEIRNLDSDDGRVLITLVADADDLPKGVSFEKVVVNDLPLREAEAIGEAEHTLTGDGRPGMFMRLSAKKSSELERVFAQARRMPIVIKGVLNDKRTFAAFRSPDAARDMAPTQRTAPAALSASRPPTKQASAPAPTPSSGRKAVDPEDPQKGLWGGLAEAHGRRLVASVERDATKADWFCVLLRVSATDPAPPLTGLATFHLHPTFHTPRHVRVQGGVAELRLLSYGAFTVGVEVDEGTTTLEFDLATLPGAPAEFASR